MATIPQKHLRNNIGEVLRQAEAGEQFTITVAGRPVAELGPTKNRTWVSGHDLAPLWALDADAELAADLSGFRTALQDPFESV